MDKLLKEIKSFLETAHNQFKSLKFKVGYGCSKTTYIVDVCPLEEFKNNEDYAKMEIDFCDSFEEQHPEYTIIFVSEGSVCKVTDPILSIGYNPLGYTPNRINFDSIFSSWQNSKSNNNYALAA